MSLDTAIARYRRRQTALFRSTCRIERPGAGEPVLNEATGELTPPAPTVVYDGACNFRPIAMTGTDVEAGAQEVHLRRLMVKLPVDTDVQEKDVVVATGSDHDAGLVGKRFQVTDVPSDSWQIARVAVIEETI